MTQVTTEDGADLSVNVESVCPELTLLQIPRVNLDDIQEGEVIGEGGFGSVHKGTMQGEEEEEEEERVRVWCGDVERVREKTKRERDTETEKRKK